MAVITRDGLREEFAILRSDVSRSNKELKEDVQNQLRRFLDDMRERLGPAPRDSPRLAGMVVRQPDYPKSQPTHAPGDETPKRPESRENRNWGEGSRKTNHPRVKGAKTTFTSSLPSQPAPLRQAAQGDSDTDMAPIFGGEKSPKRIDSSTVPQFGMPSKGKSIMRTNSSSALASGRGARETTPTTSPRLGIPRSKTDASLGDGLLLPGADRKVHPAPEGRPKDERAKTPPLQHSTSVHVGTANALDSDLPFAVPVVNMTMGEHQINIIESGVGDPKLTAHTQEWPAPVAAAKRGARSQVTWNGGDLKDDNDSDIKSEDSRLGLDWMSKGSVGCLHPSVAAVNSWLPQTYKDADVVVDASGRLSKIPHLPRTDTAITIDEVRQRSTVYLIYKGKLHPWTAFWNFCKSDYFDYFMGIFLVLNAIMIGVGVDVVTRLRDEGKDETPTWLRVVDGVFCIIFLLELTIRICMYNVEFFTMKGRWWNIFDLFVVGFSLIDEISKLFLTGTKLQEAIDQMGILRLLRLARVLRLIRMVRLIPELKSMVYLIASSMGAFFWAVMLLLIMIYCIAVYFTELSDEIIKKELVNEASRDDLMVYYGSVGTSIFTCFQAITGGDDWKVFVDMFKEHSALSFFMNSFLFSLYIGFATMVMLNLVTGVFVEGAQRIIREEKEAEIVKNVRKLFHMTDSDQSGEVSWEEFHAQLETPRMRMHLTAVDMDPNEAKALFKLLDTDRSGDLSVEEFVDGCLRFRTPARSIDINSLKYDFHDITSVWASQFAIIDTNIKVMLDMQTKIAHSLVASLPEETYVV